MNITKAKYFQDEIYDAVTDSISLSGTNKGIHATISGKENLAVPLDPANSDYTEIMRQVEAGTLTIADAD